MAALNPHMQSKSLFGVQATSKRRSAPSFGFGSSTRAQAGKVFLSQEHAKLSTPGFSPGPSAYTMRASVGSQSDGRKASSPQWVFGSSERFQQVSRKEVQNPGPGTYSAASGVGVQVSSSKHSQPLYGFGTAERSHVEKVFVSEEHNKSLYGIESPGPMMYTLQGAVGRQELSRKENQPTWVFSSSERFRYEHVKRAATSPGPGAYTMSASVGPQPSSTKTSAPLPGFGTSNRDQMQKIYISPEHVCAIAPRLSSPGERVNNDRMRSPSTRLAHCSICTFHLTCYFLDAVRRKRPSAATIRQARAVTRCLRVPAASRAPSMSHCLRGASARPSGGRRTRRRSQAPPRPVQDRTASDEAPRSEWVGSFYNVRGATDCTCDMDAWANHLIPQRAQQHPLFMASE